MIRRLILLNPLILSIVSDGLPANGSEERVSTSRMMGLLVRLILVVMAAAGVTASVASEPAYPSKPIRMLVGFSPGGGTDVAARIIGKKLSETWNQQIVIDNRAGAGGLVAFEMTAKANPDG